MRAIILTYHAHHVLGSAYHNNDHVAFPQDLHLIAAAGYQIVPLDRIVSATRACQSDQSTAEQNSKYVGITFDDGPVFDVDDFTHPTFGSQRSFLNIMRDFAGTPPGQNQRDLNATSFVIASPHARRMIEETYDAEYTFLSPGSLDDEWWPRAIESGLISIGNHSWDHLHPALPQVAHSRQVRADFTQVTTKEDADSQIARAADYIATKTKGRGVPFFAYPFGHYNDFLVDQYMPDAEAAVLRAAFTADGRPILGHESVWCLPRYVCGHHWKNPGELRALLEETDARPGTPETYLAPTGLERYSE